jgi:predicted RNA polymerase sigma factor
MLKVLPVYRIGSTPKPEAIKDDLLRMMFSCCDPRLSDLAKISLVLNILCGFSTGEVASAFVEGQDAAEKRIQRAKKLLAQSRKLFDTAVPKDFAERLPIVWKALYLLFSEGYHGASPEAVVHRDLCQEAMRLCAVLLEHPMGQAPATYALASLMCFGMARLPSRLDSSGNLTMFEEQDRSIWDRGLIEEGLMFIAQSACGSELSTYHIEAAIASVHATTAKFEETDWPKIVSLYDTLMARYPSPVVALNRAIALAQRDGPRVGLEALSTMQGGDGLRDYPFYPAAFAECELRLGNRESAREHYRKALTLARNPMERRFFERRLESCSELTIDPAAAGS